MNTQINKTNEPPSCGSCGQSRRNFLTGCAKIGAVGAFSGLVIPSIIATEGCTSSVQPVMKVRVVFGAIDVIMQRRCWPNIAYDFNPFMEKVMNALTNGCPKIEFVQAFVQSAKQAEELTNEDEARGDIDGYLPIQLSSQLRIVAPFVDSGKPVLYADFLYAGSGLFLTSSSAQIRRNVDNYAFMASLDVAHIVAAANCFPLAKGPGGNQAFVDAVAQLRQDIVAGVKVDMNCIDDKVDVLPFDELMKELKGKKILEFEKGWNDVGKEVKEMLGIEIIRLPFTELDDIGKKFTKDQTMDVVKRWKGDAASVVDVSDLTLEKAARMYLSMKQCMKNHDASAITINCFGGFAAETIPGYPCMGFFELLNEGLIGACECDTLSTITMLVMTTLTKGRPGFLSDPVMDVSTGQIIYAHCVAPNKPFGSQGASNPFTIMTHSEDRQGASIRSTLPEGYMTSTLKFNPATKEILFHQAKSVGNSTEDRACRTKLQAVPVGDFENLFKEYDRWGWHRVTYYGDLKKPVYDLADSLGWKVVEEA